MIERDQAPIICSTLNLSPQHAMLWGVEQYQSFLEETGYDGLAYYPLNNRLAAEIACGVDTGNMIDAFQQTWREESRLTVISKGVGKLVHGRSIPALKEIGAETAASLGMPHIEKSLTVISKVQERIGSSVLRPVVVHPEGQLFGDSLVRADPQVPKRDYTELGKRGLTLGELQWQPTAELALNRRITISNSYMMAELLAEEMRGDGLGRAAFDVNHAIATRRGRRIGDPHGLVARLAARGDLGTFEFSLQPHLGGEIRDLRDIMERKIAYTPHGEMLRAAIQSLPRDSDLPPVKVEIPAYAFETIGMDYRAAHKRLVETLRAFTEV